MVRALRAQTDVVVDLSELAFADSSVMLDLAVLARRLRARGREILVSGAQPQVLSAVQQGGRLGPAAREFLVRARQPQVLALIKQVGLHRLPAGRFRPSPAFA